MGMEETIVPGPNFNRPVKDLVYKDLLTITFTQASHDRGIKTWRDIGKTTIGKERTVAECKESDKTMEFICDLMCQVIEDLGPINIFSVVMDGTYKGDFPMIRVK